MKATIVTIAMFWGTWSALVAQSVTSYCTDFSISTDNFSLYSQVTDSITVVVNFSGATTSAVSNPQVDISLTNISFIEFPGLPYVYPGNIGPGQDSFTFKTPVTYIGTPPAGTQLTGDLTVYKSLPNPPFYLFACQYPVTVTILEPLATNPNAEQEAVRIYPNPAKTEVRIEGTCHATLFDAQARAIAATCIQSGDMRTWQIEHLPTGIYWIRGIDPEGDHFSRAFVKVNGQ